MHSKWYDTSTARTIRMYNYFDSKFLNIYQLVSITKATQYVHDSRLRIRRSVSVALLLHIRIRINFRIEFSKMEPQP
jgi:hypothetical protein